MSIDLFEKKVQKKKKNDTYDMYDRKWGSTEWGYDTEYLSANP